MRYRRLLWGTCSAAAAMLIAHYIPGISLWAAAAFAALTIVWLIVSGFILITKRGNTVSRDWCALILILLFTTSAGFLRSWAHQETVVKRAEQFAAMQFTADFTVRDYPVYGERYTSFTAWFYPNDGGRRISVYVTDYDKLLEAADVKPGDIITAKAHFSSASTSLGESTSAFYSRGIYLKASLREDCTIASNEAVPLQYFPKVVSHAIKNACLTAFPEKVAPFMMALLTGDKSELQKDEDTYASIRDAGISHMIAVSGMHVAFLLGAVRVFTGKGRKTAYFGIPLIVFFMAMTGFTASVVRAGVMQMLVLLAPLFGRENDNPTTLAFAGLVVLLPNPDAIAGVGFQLSFAAVAGMMLFCPYLSDAYDRVVERKLRIISPFLSFKPVKAVFAAVSGTAGALIFTLPISSVHFGSFALYGILTNILTVWAVSAAFVLGYLVCMAALIFAPLGRILGFAAGLLPGYIILVAEHISALPWAVVYTEGNLLSSAIGTCYLIIIVSVLLRGKEHWSPFVPLSCCTVVICLSVLLAEPVGVNTPLIAAVDVGQGQSIVVLEKDATIVVDCGNIFSTENAGDITSSYLSAHGRNRIDALLLTHLHTDHASGVMRLMRRQKIGMIIMPEYPEAYREGLWYDIQDEAQQKGIEVVMVSGEYLLETPEMNFKIYNPSGFEENDIGLIFLGSHGDFDVLITGDANQETEMEFVAHTPLPDIELLIAGHHGSKNSTSSKLLSSLTPEYCFISTGYNTYGHPSKDTIARLEEHNVQWLSTRQNGTLQMSAANYDIP